MNAADIIRKKRDRVELSDDEIAYIVNGYVSGEVPDYQMSAFLMAVWYSGMTDKETFTLTDVMMHSGDVLDMSVFGANTVDKHSTGGVGDKTTLIVAPLAASLGVVVPKMSGRGLGHTGGTLDKLESIPGYRTSLTPRQFFNCVKKTGLAVIGQNADITPADQKMYALRDVTSTVDSIPLIASSIMSKKLAAGAGSIVLDVTVGSGAFCKTTSEASQLAKKMVAIGKSFGRRVRAVITDMNVPLGRAVGNSIEVLEATDVLLGGGPSDLRKAATVLAAHMVSLVHDIPVKTVLDMASEALKSGRALSKFEEWISAQGGDTSFIRDHSRLGSAPYSSVYRSPRDGYISLMDAELVGRSAAELGAGRKVLTDTIDHTAGIILNKKTGDFCKKGEPIASFYSSDKKRFASAKAVFADSLVFGETAPKSRPLVKAVID